MRTLFYPFNYENREVLIYRDYLKKEYKDCIYVIENENSKNNFAELSKKYKVSAECSTDISTIIKDVEQVIILPIENMGISHYKNIIKILESKKTIKNFNKKLDGLLTDEIDKGNVCVENIYKKSNLPKEITSIEVPVIMIAGLNKYCDKFSVQILLGNYFKDKGYKVEQFSTRAIAELFGINNLPRFDEYSNCKMEEQALFFNEYMADEIKKKAPDLIIIDIDEGIVPISNGILNNFGYLARLISCAIPLDYTILNIYYQESISSDYIKMLREYTNGNLSSDLFAICVSNTMSELKPETQNREMSFFHLDTVDKTPIVQKKDIRIFTTSNKISCEKIFDNLFKAFTENISVI